MPSPYRKEVRKTLEPGSKDFMERLKKALGLSQKKENGEIKPLFPKDVRDLMDELETLEERAGIDPYDNLRKLLRERKEKLEKELEGDKPVKP